MSERSQFGLIDFICQLCGHQWQTRKNIKPAYCPACGSPYWHMPDTPKNGYVDTNNGAHDGHNTPAKPRGPLKRYKNSSRIVKKLNDLELEHARTHIQIAFYSRDWGKMEEAIGVLDDLVRRTISSELPFDNRVIT